MPIFLDTTGNSTLGIAICARCSRKFPLGELFSDPNSPGLMVCRDDLDVLDPYRLPGPTPDQINLDFVRPDVPLIVPPDPVLSTDFFYFITQDSIPLITQGGNYLSPE